MLCGGSQGQRADTPATLHFRVPGRQSLTGLPQDLKQGTCFPRCPRRRGAVPGSAVCICSRPLVTRGFYLTDGGQSSGETPLQTRQTGRTRAPALRHSATC